MSVCNDASQHPGITTTYIRASRNDNYFRDFVVDGTQRTNTPDRLDTVATILDLSGGCIHLPR